MMYTHSATNETHFYIMKTEILNRLKNHGYRKNTKGFEAFKLLNGLRFFIKVKTDEVVYGEQRYFVEFGVTAKYPFVSEGRKYSIYLMQHSIKYDEMYYGGELNDFWREDQIEKVWNQIENISLPWIKEMMPLSQLENHIKWKIEKGILFFRSPQWERYQNELNALGKEITAIMGDTPGHRINANECRRFFLDLALIAEAKGDKSAAIDYILQFVDYLKEQRLRDEQLIEIQAALNSGEWPVIP